MTLDELVKKYPKYKILYEPQEDCYACNGTGEHENSYSYTVPCICVCVLKRDMSSLLGDFVDMKEL